MVDHWGLANRVHHVCKRLVSYVAQENDRRQISREQGGAGADGAYSEQRRASDSKSRRVDRKSPNVKRYACPLASEYTYTTKERRNIHEKNNRRTCKSRVLQGDWVILLVQSPEQHAAMVSTPAERASRYYDRVRLF